ncbi:hypothetical protein TNCV_2304461 [Trichonephila clavipes]|nr:hypothetical protein TNCV_2304461 [Trichonephila clavipes]
MSCEYHLCYAHAIHLAVCDVLYNKQIDLVENTVEVEDKSHEEEDNGESEELVEDLDKALDLKFESSSLAGWRGWFVISLLPLRLWVRPQPKLGNFHHAENRQWPCRMIKEHVKDPLNTSLDWVLLAKLNS